MFISFFIFVLFFVPFFVLFFAIFALFFVFAPPSFQGTPRTRDAARIWNASHSSLLISSTGQRLGFTVSIFVIQHADNQGAYCTLNQVHCPIQVGHFTNCLDSVWFLLIVELLSIFRNYGLRYFIVE